MFPPLEVKWIIFVSVHDVEEKKYATTGQLSAT